MFVNLIKVGKTIKQTKGHLLLAKYYGQNIVLIFLIDLSLLMLNK